MAEGRGGARTGSGRIPKGERYQTAIRAAEDKIRDHLPMIVDRMIELVDGVTVQEPDGNGGVRVYTRWPDRAAGIYLMDRLMGKPTERQEFSGEIGIHELGAALQARRARGAG